MIGRALSAISRQVRRASERAGPARRSIDAGGGGRRWEGSPWLADPARDMRQARDTARHRAAGMVANDPFAARAVDAWTASLVGGGGWQARSHHPDEAARRRLNSEFEALIGPLLAPVARAIVRDGEAIVHLRVGDDGLRPRLIPAAQLDSSLTREAESGRRIEQGIELDENEDPVAYHILRPAPGGGLSLQADRIPAEDILHIFELTHPGQRRGLSWLAPVLLTLRDRSDLRDAILMQAKVAALLTGYVSSPDGGDAGLSDGGAASGGAVDLSLEPGAVRVLPPGAHVEMSDPPNGLSQVADMARGIDRNIAAGIGLSYEQLTGDLAEASYSAARSSLLAHRRLADMKRRDLIERQFLRPLWRRWIRVELLRGAVTAETDDDLAADFIAPGWQWVDPQRESAAALAENEAGVRSKAEIIAARGRDPDEVLAEIAAERAAGEGGDDAA